MRMLKAAGLAVLVLVAWMIGATIVGALMHVGQVYDPGMDAWFTVPSKELELASFTGNAVLFGIVVSVVVGAVYYFAGRGPKKTQAEQYPQTAVETQEERDGRIIGEGSSGAQPRA